MADRDHVHLLCDRGVEMMHTHACLQEEEEEDGSRGDDCKLFMTARTTCVKLYPRLLRIESLEI